MKRHFSIATVSMALIATSFGQRAPHAAPASSSFTSRQTVDKKGSKSPNPVASKAQAVRFQQVAAALRLNHSQQKSVGNLVQNTRQQLRANTSNGSLSPDQQALAAQTIKSDMVQKFVALLTPGQKKELAAMLLKRQQQQQQSSQNSSSGNSGSAPSAPDIPSVDAPSPSDDDDSQPASASSSDTNSGQTDSSSLTGTADAQATVAKSEPSKAASSTATSGQLTDAQLAAILNSFVQDDAGQVASKPSGQPAGGSPTS